MARELGRHFPVTLGLRRPAGVSSTQTPEAPPALHALETAWWDRSSVGALVERHSLVISLGMQYPARVVATTRTVQVFDLYDPVVLEHLAGSDLAGGAEADPASLGHLQALTRLLLECGDYFLCASPQQRDLWLGGLYATGRLARAGCGDALVGERALVGLVPFGHDGAPPPRAARPVLKGVHPKIAPSDRLLLWGGGIWNWSDPLSLIRAVAGLAKRRDNVKLFFMASRHAGADTVGREMLERAVALARQLGVLDESVLFNETWVPFEERGAYLQESDLAVCTTPEGLENHFSFRTRLVDAVWCGVPIVCTRDGFFGDFVEREGLGLTVAGGDAEGLEAALEQALEPEAQARFRSNLERCRDLLRWDRCLEPLVAFCRRVAEGRYQPPQVPAWRRWGRWLRYKTASRNGL